MAQTIIVTFSMFLLVILGIAFLAGVAALVIIALSKVSPLFLKLYLYFFEREDYNTYKEAKEILKSGGSIPICSGYTDTKKQEGLYFMVMPEDVSIWRGEKCCLVRFHQFLLDELIKIGNLEEPIQAIREADIKHMKYLKDRIAKLKKEITEEKQD